MTIYLVLPTFQYVGLPVPDYEVSHWAEDYERIYRPWLNIQILHTPGHTPDELAYYDQDEQHLLVGDTLFERVAYDKSYEQPIFFPEEGNSVHYMESLEKLIVFVKEKNAEADKQPVKIGCGHVTSLVDASDKLLAVKRMFLSIFSRKKREAKFVLFKATQDIPSVRPNMSKLY